ncbi:MAG: carbonate dehydratase [Pseudomonadales bacterium]|uniref:Carbonic anhydrase n=1 Tax=Oleiphilus messinensis TaxID=141451 RepID=A0A1Y0IGJ5_9GAMM|nr:carbonate dehydratase [Oleiphilus messinensis]ARU58504.1 carbonate dehydratase [Oleiphilus messinensis]MCG8611021.1 carbonate dehydratase [Pseudomonadales bacterium]
MPVSELIENNRKWAAQITDEDPEFFEKLSKQQSPEFLWIGCSDSRVPANEIVGLLPGELFVHRNVANLVVHTDLNCLSVVQYAVEVLKVKHIIVCGHYGCGGVRAVIQGSQIGLINNWLRHVGDIAEKYQTQLEQVEGISQKTDLLCELNVISQVSHVTQTTIVQDAWARGQPLYVHGWIYAIENGLVNNLGVSVNAADLVKDKVKCAIDNVLAKV